MLPKSVPTEAVSEVKVDALMADAKAAEVAGVLNAGVEPDPIAEIHGKHIHRGSPFNP